MGFPWEREWESESDGNGNDSTGKGGIGSKTIPVKGKKSITHCSVIYNVSLSFVMHHKLEAHLLLNLTHSENMTDILYPHFAAHTGASTPLKPWSKCSIEKVGGECFFPLYDKSWGGSLKSI
jgi:hypothetical protein